MAWIASAMQLPQMRDLFADRSGVTIFAPLDGAQGDDADTRADDDTARDVQAPPRGFIHPEGALGLEQLLAGSPISLADGGQLEVSIEGDRAWLFRDDARVEIVCADLVLDGAVLHVTDGIPFGSTAGDESTEADADPDRQSARDPTTQPDPSNDEAGTSP